MSVTMREMLEAGVHFGHQTRFWNPKMAPFIFGHRNKIHIINLEQTVSNLDEALKYIKQLSQRRGTVMFVGTKRQSREIIAEEAGRAGMPFVDQRWLGGMLTNFSTIRKRLTLLEQLEAREQAGEFELMSKKEAAKLRDKLEKLRGVLGGMYRSTRASKNCWYRWHGRRQGLLRGDNQSRSAPWRIT